MVIVTEKKDVRIVALRRVGARRRSTVGVGRSMTLVITRIAGHDDVYVLP